MTEDELVEAISVRINRDGDVSFAVLANSYPEEFSDGEFLIEVKPNLVLWHGLSELGVAVVRRLRERFDLSSTSALCYMIDGRGLTIPVAKQAKEYKRPHWLPVLFVPRKKAS